MKHTNLILNLLIICILTIIIGCSINGDLTGKASKTFEQLNSEQKQVYWKCMKDDGCSDLLKQKSLTYMSCALNCMNKATQFTSEQNWCEDSDNGKDYFTEGTVTSNLYPYPEGKKDYCKMLPTGKTYLFEGACNKNNKYFYYQKNCGELGKGYVCKERKCVKDVPLKKAQIIDLPFSENIKCFLTKEEYKELPLCKSFYKEICYSTGFCNIEFACPKYYNPVYDSNGVFYPSACWAEQLGVINYEYGYSPQFIQLFKDLWQAKRTEEKYFITVNNPEIEFSYNSAFFRSTLWKDQTNFYRLDFYLDGVVGSNLIIPFFSSHSEIKTLISPVNKKMKTLLVFLMIDEAYPPEILIEWTKKYEPLLNDYIKKKLLIPSPVEYEFTPVIINPSPLSKEAFFQDISDIDQSIEQSMLETIYNSAISKVGGEYETLIIAPVIFNGYGGYFSYWNNMELIVAPFELTEPYSETDIKKGVNSLAAFQFTFITISHEILHAFGLSGGDHFPMGYGTYFLDIPGINTDLKTGKFKEEPNKFIEETKFCDFLGLTSEYYAVEIPDNLKISVGNEPEWTTKTESVSGPCLSGIFYNNHLKDIDSDGSYEIMYINNPIGIELQRTLGWVDIDGDGISEIIDPIPYSGLQKEEFNMEIELINKGLKQNNIGPFSFEETSITTINNCIFAQITLENGLNGITPIQCEAFNHFVNNLYHKMKYYWYTLNTKEYGDVLIPGLF